jgi:16S rRNA (cytosine967-C5)-methyltransferase
MIPAARIAAAIDVIADIAARRRPAADALKDWGQTHRFAGSKDRAAIASLVYDALRRKASSAWLMGEATPRAEMLGMLRELRGHSPAEIASLFSGEGHAPAALSAAESAALEAGGLVGAPDHIAGDYPEWLAPAFAETYGVGAVEEGRALAARAPVDLRVNRLAVGRDKALVELEHLSARSTPLSPIGLRLPLTADGRGPALSAEPAYVKGHVEIQDEGSQIAALCALAQPGEQILDYCAGGGGKTLALAAVTQNKGQIYAYDSDGRRLMPIYARLERAGARNVQVRAPKGQADVLSDLRERCDLVVVDAPCTGSGAWRRNPDAKWRIRPGALEQRMKDQDEAIRNAARFVKKGGRLLYITCSLLRQENEERLSAFLGEAPDFASMDPAEMVRRAGLPMLVEHARGLGLRLSPAATGTDGFFIAMLTRAA